MSTIDHTGLSYQHRLPGFAEKVIALYARGMTAREIQAPLQELNGIDVSPELISVAARGIQCF